VAQVLKNLGLARLVTLTGPGGVGKTRLAAEVSGLLAGGAWFVELAPVSDPAGVAYAVLDALGVRERVISRRTGDPGAGPLDRLAAALADRDDVLILDNCEHVIEAAAALAGRVLAACPRVRIVATSRQPLRIGGETLCPIPPLPVPPPSHAEGPESYASVRLLRDRAAAVRPDFELDASNTAAVARICRALDGMPLAIELAAVWLRTLTPAQLAERLDDRFALLTGGSRAALPRHRTLRAVVDWSWDLLEPAEQVLAQRRGGDAEAEDHAEAQRHRHRDAVAHHVAQDRAGQRRPARDRQAAEPSKTPLAMSWLSIRPVPSAANTTLRTKIPGSENCRYACVPPTMAPPKTYETAPGT
jgi:predicted ATPase